MADPEQAIACHEQRGRFRSFFLGQPNSRRDHMGALDGLRGLAVLIVLVSHMSNSGFLPWPGLAGTGKSGVYLFFVLSSFLLTRALLKRPLADFANAWRWADYALRRVLRIWPLYLVLLLSSWVLTMAGVSGWHYQMDTHTLLRHLALQEGMSVLWSIPVEFIFYLFLPFIAFVLAWMRVSRRPVWLEVVVAMLGLALATWSWPPGDAHVNDVRLGPYLVVFLCGAYAARLDLHLQDKARKFPVWWWLVGLLALLAWGLTVPSVWAWVMGEPFLASLNHTWFVFSGSCGPRCCWRYFMGLTG